MKTIPYYTLALLLAVGTLHAQTEEKAKSSKLGKPVFPKFEYVNLNAELGLPSEILRGFGAQVDDAVRDADPEAVAALAVLLAFAEELATMNAQKPTVAPSLTSATLLEQAVRIAIEQENRDAVRGIVAASRRVSGGDTIAARMNEAMALFATHRGGGEFVAYVQVQNTIDRVLDVYIDGNYVGPLYSGESRTFSTGNGVTNARVVDAFGNAAGEQFVLESRNTFTWTIQP